MKGRVDGTPRGFAPLRDVGGDARRGEDRRRPGSANRTARGSWGAGWGSDRRPVGVAFDQHALRDDSHALGARRVHPAAGNRAGDRPANACAGGSDLDGRCAGRGGPAVWSGLCGLPAAGVDRSCGDHGGGDLDGDQRGHHRAGPGRPRTAAGCGGADHPGSRGSRRHTWSGHSHGRDRACAGRLRHRAQRRDDRGHRFRLSWGGHPAGNLADALDHACHGSH